MTLVEPKTWEGQVYSGGWTASRGGTAAIVEPATGAELGTVGVADAEDVASACKAAAAAQREWAAAPFLARAAVLRQAGALIEQYADELHQWMIRETGSIPGMVGFATHVASQECYEAAALASRPIGEILPSEQPRLSLLRRVPVGVVGVISPFNAPMILSSRSVAPALALGNAVVLKPDPRTPVSGGFLFARIFEEAGLPEGLLHVLPGGAEAGQALVRDPHTRVISFTGSTAVGRRVAAAGAEHLKRVHLELGGNSALVILDDVDVEKVASVGAWGSFLHQGQICMTAGRHIVHESIADDYVAALASHADRLPVGDPAAGQVALGPLIDAGQRDKVHRLVTSTVDSGARLAAGGTYEGLFYRPTVLDLGGGGAWRSHAGGGSQVATDAPAYREEVFGPVAPVIRFATPEEAVALAADTSYGLSLGILTGDAMRGLALAEQIPTGIVHINDQTVNDEAVAPFGGVLDSGTGARFGGLANQDAFTDQRWITVRSEVPAYPF